MKFWIKTLKLLNRIFHRPNKLSKMYNLKRRRESVATVYKKTTKFLTSNTVNLLKKMPNTRKYHLLAKIVDDHEEDKETTEDDQSDVSDYGDRELDYYLGVRKKETYWRDPMGIEQVRKDYLLYHCGVSEEEYEKLHKKTIAKPSYVIQPRLKQVPFKIHKKNKKLTLREGSETWRERRNIFRIFVNKRDTESTSDSYSECDDDDENADVTKCLNSLNIVDTYDIPQGVRIKEVSEGRPCDNCPELCPGFISHPWRHENCPWEQALKSADVTWSGLKYTCLKILHLYCKVFEREDVLDLLIRKTCKSCGCDRLKHSVYHEELCSVRDRLGLRETRSHHAYDNSPPGLTAKQTELYWSSLAERAPTIGGATGTAAWRAWRTRALATQLPKQDLSLAHCSNIDESHHKQFEDFVAARNEIALDIGIASQYHGKSILCYGCLKQIRSGSIVIQAPKLEEEEYYHPSCFTCSVCEELLVELAYCALDGRLFCVRHYDERLKPRCHACDELIFSSEYTKAMNKDWHSGHFCCWQCDESLTGQRYVLRDENPYCIKCYESAFANGCEECNKTIGIDSKDLSYKDKHWHEACFLCAKCRVSLVDKQFGSKHDKIYCGNCYDAQFASRCDGCGEVFRAGTKKMEYKTRQWHEKCFCCVVCKNPIGTKSFIPREQEIYCAGCYEDKFATRCVKCNKIITQGGVTYKNEPWHRECFTCTNCDTPLAGQRFTSRDEKPYCAECFGELFAKRCTSCTKPITGIGGTRFISFEDRHWHNHCFICAQCQTSLVGKGFITGGPDIICPECAKQKLM